MTTREAQKLAEVQARLKEALGNLQEQRLELERTRNLLEACAKRSLQLDQKVTDLLADITAITRMDGKE